MNKKTFMAGMLAGLSAGAIMGMLADPLKDRQTKAMRKTTGKAFRTLGSIIDMILEK